MRWLDRWKKKSGAHRRFGKLGLWGALLEVVNADDWWFGKPRGKGTFGPHRFEGNGSTKGKGGIGYIKRLKLGGPLNER